LHVGATHFAYNWGLSRCLQAWGERVLSRAAQGVELVEARALSPVGGGLQVRTARSAPLGDGLAWSRPL